MAEYRRGQGPNALPQGAATGLNARTPVVGLTADVLNLDRQDWRAAGMNACHHKPLDADTLADLFGRWGIGRPAQTASLSAFLRKYYER